MGMHFKFPKRRAKRLADQFVEWLEIRSEVKEFKVGKFVNNFSATGFGAHKI